MYENLLRCFSITDVSLETSRRSSADDRLGVHVRRKVLYLTIFLLTKRKSLKMEREKTLF